MNTLLNINTGKNTAATIALPRRFDVHEVDHVISTLRAHTGHRVVVDGAHVEMIDMAALDALAMVATLSTLTIEAPSVALEATVRYAGSDNVVAALAPAMIRQAA